MMCTLSYAGMTASHFGPNLLLLRKLHKIWHLIIIKIINIVVT